MNLALQVGAFIGIFHHLAVRAQLDHNRGGTDITDQGLTGFTAPVKDFAEKSETRFAQTTDFFNRFVFPLRGRSPA